MTRPLTLALPRDPEDLARAQHVARTWATLDHPHLLVPTLVEESPSAVVVDPGDRPGPTLAVALDGEGLTPGQVVTLGVPLGQALAAAVAVAVGHGGVDPAAIALAPGGRPVLCGIGLAQVTGLPAPHTDDVHALARLLDALLSPGPGEEAVRAALRPGLSGHPAARGQAADLAAALLGACPPEPLPDLHPSPKPGVRVVVPEPLVPPRRWPPARVVPVLAWCRDRRRPVRGVAAAGVATVLVGLAVLTVARGRPGPAPTLPGDQVRRAAPAASSAAAPVSSAAAVTTATSAAVDWAAELTALARARHEAFRRADPTRLTLADAPGSPALAVDAARLARWRAAGLRLRGDPPRVVVRGAPVVSGATAQVRVTESLGAWDAVAADGSIAGHQGAAAARTWTVHLVRIGPSWRTERVSPP